MKSTIGKLALSLVLIFAFVGITAYPLAFYTYDDRAIITEKVSENGIGKVEIEIKGQQIFMNIHLDEPMSCAQALKVLEISNLDVDGKTYSPICNVINYHLLRINYEETVSI